jgi:hypothetical protein
MTLRGLFAPVRINAIEVTNLDLAARNMPDQSLVSLIHMALGSVDLKAIRLSVTGIIGLGLILFAFLNTEFRKSRDNILSGICVGLIVTAGWFITGNIGFDEFEPVRLESYTFVAPVGENVNYLMTFTGATINFGIAAVFGVATGSFLYAVLAGKFAIETFASRADMIAHLFGSVLMGFGGVLALGCTIGQGVSGMSTLALGSVITLVSIIFGSALTMKVLSHLLDEQPFFRAVRQSLADMNLLPSDFREK